MTNNDNIKWHVLHAMFGRAIKAEGLFQGLNIDCYVPMEYRHVTVKGKKPVRKLVPSLSNLIFVNTTLERLQEIRTNNRYLWYLTHTVDGRVEPMTVPKEQMDAFRSFVEGRYEQVEYIDTKSFNIKKGERVRIIDGDFKGYEALFVSISGKRRRQIVVTINGILAVTITHPNPSQIIEKIK